jgi:hypothetical protein
LDEAGSRRGIDLIEARAAVGAKTVHRRRRNRQLFAVATVAVIAAITVPVLLLREDPARTVRVAPQPIEEVDGWAAIRKTTAGLDADASFSALSISGHSPYSLLIAGYRQPTIWYSDNGLAWKPGEVPATTTGSVSAIATNGETALAIGTDGAGFGAGFVWQSEDAGRNWSVVANSDGLFGPAAAQMGRPFVSGLTDAFGMWIAWGGGSDGYAAVWTSSDGRQWQQVLDTKPGKPDTGVGGVNVVVDARNGHLLAYGGNVIWESSDGTTWGEPVIASVPKPFSLETIAPGDTLAFGENQLTHGQPTPLLRRADGQQTWFVDPTFLAQFPDARVRNVTRWDDLWIAAGTSGSPNHPDAWVSLDGITWRSMPASVYGSSDGAGTVDSSWLSLAASVGGRVVLFGTTPELDRYYTIDATKLTDQLRSAGTQDAGDRYLCTFGIEEAQLSADGLPYFTGAVTERATVERALQESRSRLLADNPEVTDITVGPGFRRAWKGVNGGPYEIVYVHDYALLLHVKSDQDCPRGDKPLTFPSGVEVFYTAP